MRGASLRVSFLFWALLLLAVWAGENAAMLLAAAAIHEGGHLLALFCFGGRIASVRLSALGIRIRPRFSRMPSRRRRAVMLLAGPLAGLAAAVLALRAGNAAFAVLNAALSGLNLLPLRGLDGGELRALFRP